MAVDTPATIAILGAGPVGLEAALYARFLGYDVELYERAAVGQQLLSWGHVPMFTPFAATASPLGLAALKTHDQGYQPPAADVFLTAAEWAQQYLIPLAQTDLLIDHVHEQTTVVSVSRQELLKPDWPRSPDRGETMFRILLRNPDGSESSQLADIVIDATGLAEPLGLGPGGAPAIGETALRSSIEYGLPDIAARDRGRYAGRHTLVVGTDCSAAINVVALGELAKQEPGTRVTWVTRPSPVPDENGLFPGLANDPLPARRERLQAAVRLVAGADAVVMHWSETLIEAVAAEAASGRFLVRVSGNQAGVHGFDQILANVGARGDDSLYRELQVCGDVADESLAKAADPAAASSSDSAASSGHSSGLLQTEANFYVLGAKSYGRRPGFLVSTGLLQVRELFAIIGDRPDLNLYATVKLD